MGMFDSFYGADGSEWQTKAFDCTLARWDIGDVVPGPPIDYQAEVIGGPDKRVSGFWSLVTVREGRLASVGDYRNPKLPLCLYSSGWEPGKGGTA